jgi:hypothetical protein
MAQKHPSAKMTNPMLTQLAHGGMIVASIPECLRQSATKQCAEASTSRDRKTRQLSTTSGKVLFHFTFSAASICQVLTGGSKKLPGHALLATVAFRIQNFPKIENSSTNLAPYEMLLQFEWLITLNIT